MRTEGEDQRQKGEQGERLKHNLGPQQLPGQKVLRRGRGLEREGLAPLPTC